MLGYSCVKDVAQVHSLCDRRCSVHLLGEVTRSHEDIVFPISVEVAFAEKLVS